MQSSDPTPIGGRALSESPTKSGRVEGFTLVELMVVILIKAASR